MVENMKSEKKDRNREAFVKAAEALFQKWGIHKTTLEDIAREAGKGKSSIYYYFPNKEAVIEAVIMAQGERITRLVCEESEKKKSAREKLLAVVSTSFRETRRATTLYTIAKGEIRADRKLIDGVMETYGALQEEIVEGILRFGIARKEFRSIGEHNVKTASRAVVTVMRSLIISLFIENDDMELIDQIIMLLTEGL
jgi:AcrR family transcriptional regulator